MVANFLSRINNEGEVVHVEDKFPNEHLFAISIDSPWFVGIVNYMATGKLPRHLSYKEKHKIMRQSASYSEHAIMNHVGGTLLTSEMLIKSFIWDIICLLFLEIPRSMSKFMIIVREWSSQYNQMKCLCYHKL
jgi:hypothetical protein